MNPFLRRTLAQVRFDTATALRNGEQLLVTLILPVIAMVGLVSFDAVPLAGEAEVGRVPAAFAGALALGVASSAFTAPAIALAFDRRWGVLRMLATTPLGPVGLILGRLGAVIAVLVVQVVVLGSVALILAGGWHGAFGQITAGAWVSAVATVILGAAAMGALGLLVGGTLRPEAVLALANTLWVLFASVGGLLLALDHLPGPMGLLLGWLPSAALGEGLRAAVVWGQIDGLALGVLALWSAVVGAIAVRTVRWD